MNNTLAQFYNNVIDFEKLQACGDLVLSEISVEELYACQKRNIPLSDKGIVDIVLLSFHRNKEIFDYILNVYKTPEIYEIYADYASDILPLCAVLTFNGNYDSIINTLLDKSCNHLFKGSLLLAFASICSINNQEEIFDNFIDNNYDKELFENFYDTVIDIMILYCRESYVKYLKYYWLNCIVNPLDNGNYNDIINTLYSRKYYKGNETIDDIKKELIYNLKSFDFQILNLDYKKEAESQKFFSMERQIEELLQKIDFNSDVSSILDIFYRQINVDVFYPSYDIDPEAKLFDRELFFYDRFTLESMFAKWPDEYGAFRDKWRAYLLGKFDDFLLDKDITDDEYDNKYSVHYLATTIRNLLK